MKRSTFAIIGLVVALIGSNLWWVYRAIDAGVTAAYQDDSFRAASTALKQHEAILPLVLEGKRNKAEIVAAAKAAADDSESFEKGKRPAVPPVKNIRSAASCDFLTRRSNGHHIEMASAY